MSRLRPRPAALALVVATTVVAASLAPAGGGSLPVWDKLLHAVAYAAVAGTVWVAVRFSARRRAVVAAGGAILLGLAVEAAQATRPTRTADPADAAANAVGAVCAVGFVLLVRALRGTDDTPAEAR